MPQVLFSENPESLSLACRLCFGASSLVCRVRFGESYRVGGATFLFSGTTFGLGGAIFFFGSASLRFVCGFGSASFSLGGASFIFRGGFGSALSRLRDALSFVGVFLPRLGGALFRLGLAHLSSFLLDLLSETLGLLLRNLLAVPFFLSETLGLLLGLLLALPFSSKLGIPFFCASHGLRHDPRSLGFRLEPANSLAS